MNNKENELSCNDRILITGGSGFIGTNAVQYLIDRKFNFINIDIKPPQNSNHIDYWRNVDIKDKMKLESLLKEYKPKYILHLAAMTGMGITDMSYFDANTIGVQNLIDCANKVVEIKRILFTSSLLVCKNGYIPSNYEDYCPPNLYGKSKEIGEKIVKSTKNFNWSWSIVRPTSIWGPYFSHSYRAFFKAINKGYYFHTGNLQISKPQSYVGNTVFMIFKILFSKGENVESKTFYLADFPYTTTRKWANIIKEELGNGRIKSMPLWFLKWMALGGDIFRLFGAEEPPISSFRLNNMLTGGLYPIENTIEVCEELPYSIRDGVKETIDWLKRIGEL